MSQQDKTAKKIRKMEMYLVMGGMTEEQAMKKITEDLKDTEISPSFIYWSITGKYL